MDAATLVRSESLTEEPTKSRRDKKKRPTADENEEEEVEYRCTKCDYSTLCWDSMKNHRSLHSNSLRRKSPSAPSEAS